MGAAGYTDHLGSLHDLDTEALVPFDSKHITMIFRKKSNFEYLQEYSQIRNELNLCHNVLS